MVLSPKAAGVGLTITAANHVIHLSRWWNPAVEDQCNDRVYRIGQSKPVTVHVPMAVHRSLGDRSFDANLDRLLESKRSLSRHMLAPPVGEADVGVLFNETIGTSEGGTRL
jgi:SNF2 family DNA or RNA helicase